MCAKGVACVSVSARVQMRGILLCDACLSGLVFSSTVSPRTVDGPGAFFGESLECHLRQSKKKPEMKAHLKLLAWSQP